MNLQGSRYSPMAEVKMAARLYFLWLISNHTDEKYKAAYVAEFSTGLYTESVDKRVWQYYY